MYNLKKKRRHTALFIALFAFFSFPIIAFADNNKTEYKSNMEKADYTTIIGNSEYADKLYSAMQYSGVTIPDDDNALFNAIYGKTITCLQEGWVSETTTGTTYDYMEMQKGQGGIHKGTTTYTTTYVIDRESAESTINYICSNIEIDGSKKSVDDAFKKRWKEYLQESCNTYGVSDDIDDIIAKYNDLDKASAKIQLLTWDGVTEGASDDLTLKQHQGQLYTLIAKSTSLYGKSDGSSMPIFSYMQYIGTILMFVYFFKEINDLEETRAMSDEEILRAFIKFLLALTVMWHIDYIALLLVRLACYINSAFIGQSLTQNQIIIDSSGNAQLALIDSLFKTRKDIPADGIKGLTKVAAAIGSDYVSTSGFLSGLTDMLNGFMSSTINVIGNGFFQLASSLPIYGVLVESIIRFLFSPIYIADLASTERHPHGYEQLKKLVACIVSGTIMFLIIYLCDFLKTNLDTMSHFWVNLTCLGMLAKAKSLAFEMFGCR